MTGTINNQIPFVPENTIDPAAGLNLSLNTIDALLQVLVQTVGENTPPAGVEGQRFIVGTAPAGAWAGQASKLARFMDGAWQFFDARYVLNAADGAMWVRSGSTWNVLSGGAADGSITNTKLADVPSQTIKGRATAGAGEPEDLTSSQVRNVLSVRETLTANRTYHVRTDGNDANTGLVNTASGAFLTIQRAIDVASSLDLGIFNCVILVADGTYASSLILKGAVGSGQIQIIGNETTPANVIINATGDTVYGNNFGYYLLSGFSLRGTARNVFVEGATSFLQIGNINFGSQVTTINSHCTASRGALIFMVGPLVVSSNALVFGWALSRATLFFRNNTITFASGLTLSQHGFRSTVQGLVDILNVSFVGSFTGVRYQVNALSLIWTNGAGASFIPGSADGVSESGGVYA